MIVLVVIAFVTTGVLGGRYLIRQAEINHITVQWLAQQHSVETFFAQYQQLPGDMSNATSIWSLSSDGDGDGRIETGVGPPAYEDLLAWEHLYRAREVDAVYTGALVSGEFEPGVNIPSARMTNGAFWLRFNGFSDGTNTFNAHWITFAAKTSADDNEISGAILSVQETLQLDRKIDDGSASTGRLWATTGTNNESTCTTGATPPVYDKDSEGISCIAHWSIAPPVI